MRKVVEVYYWDELFADAKEWFSSSPEGKELRESYIYDFMYDKKHDIKIVLSQYGISGVKIYYDFNISSTIGINAEINLDKFISNFPELKSIIDDDETLSEDEKETFWNNYCANRIEYSPENCSSEIVSVIFYHTGDSTRELEKALNEKINRILEENSIELYKIVMETTFDDILHNDTQRLFTEDGILVGDEEFIYVKYEV